jgi:hypothetical protein
VMTRREWLRVQTKVKDHFLRSCHYPTEIGVRREGPRIINDHRRRLMGVWLRLTVSPLFLITHVLFLFPRSNDHLAR